MSDFKLTPKQVKAASLEAQGFRAVDIAKEIKVSVQTVSAYRRNEGYQILVNKIAAHVFAAAQLKLIEGSQKASETLIALLDDKSASLRLRAAQSILAMVGVNNLAEGLGPTSIVELKGNSQYGDLIDPDYFKQIYESEDEYLEGVSL